MRYKAIRITLVFIEACIGLSAIGGGIALLKGVMGQWLPVAFLQGTPFSDYLIPGLVLTVVVGGGMLLAATTQFIAHEWAVLLSVAMGLIIIGWEIAEIAIIDRYAQAVVPSTVVQQVLFAVLGLTIIGLSAYVWITEYRGQPVPGRHTSHPSCISSESQECLQAGFPLPAFPAVMAFQADADIRTSRHLCCDSELQPPA